MAKVMLTMDEPSSCSQCDISTKVRSKDFVRCTVLKRVVVRYDNCIPNDCPLREVPQKKEDNLSIHIPYNEGYLKGWNDCVDETLGEKR